MRYQDPPDAQDPAQDPRWRSLSDQTDARYRGSHQPAAGRQGLRPDQGQSGGQYPGQDQYPDQGQSGGQYPGQDQYPAQGRAAGSVLGARAARGASIRLRAGPRARVVLGASTRPRAGPAARAVLRTTSGPPGRPTGSVTRIPGRPYSSGPRPRRSATGTAARIPTGTRYSPSVPRKGCPPSSVARKGCPPSIAASPIAGAVAW